MSGLLEVAFDMIESHLLSQSDDLQILGIYEAPLQSKSQDQNVSSVGQAIAQQLRINNQVDPLIIEFDAITRQRQVNDQMQQYQKMQIEGFSLNQNGSPTKCEMNEIEFQIIEPYYDDKRYLQLCDFDDHFENINNDWLNRHLIK
ncbi:UNKNOWN [Stylonychia lemnae]|uniref:Uncharacterized protein n=1 Tax=Stylonychia lemnae TaxID=5949 RepID=A0A078AEY7_STYLE|nr:UNKNOWN [Stylonychia lemnae]|eukprot:CDW80082.1 UNKNOWN [Stylonychia lemnae]